MRERWEDYEPVSVAEQVAKFREALAADPTQSPDAIVQARIRELMEVA